MATITNNKEIASSVVVMYTGGLRHVMEHVNNMTYNKHGVFITYTTHKQSITRFVPYHSLQNIDVIQDIEDDI